MLPPPTRRIFIIIDMVFHEDLMYFSSDSELQGKCHHKIKTLDYDYYISMKGEYGLLNQEVSELDISDATLESSSISNPEAEEVIEEERNSKTNPLSSFEQIGFENTSIDIQHQSSSSKGVLNLEPEPSMKRLSHYHNKGTPKTTYEPKLSSKVRHPMSNYVSNHRLFESNKSLVNQLCIMELFLIVCTKP